MEVKLHIKDKELGLSSALSLKHKGITNSPNQVVKKRLINWLSDNMNIKVDRLEVEVINGTARLKAPIAVKQFLLLHQKKLVDELSLSELNISSFI